MPTQINSAGITFNDATSFTSATLAANSVGATQIANGSVTAAKLGTTEQKQIAKAWVNFDGTLATPITPRASFNVSSVTKNATGDYTVNFTTNFADENYSFLKYDNLFGAGEIGARLSSSCNFTTKNNTATKGNASVILCVAFGN